MRPIAAPFVVAPPAGVRVRARLKVDAGDEAVLGVIGEHLGSLAGKDLAARCKEMCIRDSTEDGPRRWRLNAYKNYSTLGHVAQGVLVWCRWPGGEGAKGIGAVVVPTDREGVSITGRHKGMGIHAATEAELAFDAVEITEDDILIAGEPGNTTAFKVLLGHLNHERCGNASMCIGAAQGAFEHAVRYMSERLSLIHI